MTKKDKLIKRVLSRPTDLTWEELTQFLSLYGFQVLNAGKTSGSARKFIQDKTKKIICIHKPHPKNIIKDYVFDIVFDAI